MVIDGDDWVFTKNLERFVDYLCTVNDDMVVSNCTYEFANHSTVSYGIRKNGDYNFRIHTVTYKTDIFRENNIKVREHVFYEDSQYVLFPLEYVKTISYFNEAIARYRQDNPTQSINPNVQFSRRHQYEAVLDDLLVFFERIKDKKDINYKMMSFIKNSISRIMYGAYELNWSYCRDANEAIDDCKRIDLKYKKHRSIYQNMKKKYKKFRQMSFLNFNGIKIARMVHKNGKKI